MAETTGHGPLRGLTNGVLRAVVAVPAYPALLLLLATAAVVQPRLMSIPFLLIVLRQAVPLALTALGQSLPIIGRSIDLSIAGVIAVVNVMLALPLFSDGPLWLSIIVPLAFGAGVGLANAFFVAVLRASAVVITLGMSVVLVGVSYIISGGAPGGEVHPFVREIATGRWGRFPIAGAFAIALALALALFLRRSAFGQALYATGANYSAAWLAGLPVRRVLTTAHVLSGMFAAAAGIILTGYIGTGTLNLGSDLVMASIAAVVLGGTIFGGGIGGIAGIFAGALALTFLANLMTGMGLGKPAQLIVQGAIIAAAAALARGRPG